MKNLMFRRPRRISFSVFVVVFFLSTFLVSTVFARSLPKVLIPAEDWIRVEAEISRQKLRTHFQYPGIAPGAVIASPQKSNPNYFRHWIRDGALVVSSIVPFTFENKQTYWRKFISDYILFSLKNQATTANFGEPIFEVDGSLFTGPWGRPQTDGPALRALAMMDWADHLISIGDIKTVEAYLYKSSLPAKTLIKADLEYVAYHWRNSSFDLWEEVRADHFFTRMVQYKALIRGAEFALKMNDPYASVFYQKEASDLKNALMDHYEPKGATLIPSLNFQEGVSYKYSRVDIAVLLGALRGANSVYPLESNEVRNSFYKIVKAFADLYPVNQRFNTMAPALGRYPEDIYGGVDFNGGNPWVLATLAAAEYSYEMSLRVNRKFDVNYWFNKGDEFLQRVQLHANPDGSLAEQIHRDTGFMVSAADLSWNYAAILTTADARTRAWLHKLNFK